MSSGDKTKRLAKINEDIAYLKSEGVSETSDNANMKKLIAERTSLSSSAAPAAPAAESGTIQVSGLLNSLPATTIVWIILVVIQAILFYVGAAKLSYDRFRSIGWAIVAFLFAPLYYLYYAFFVSAPASPVMVAAARRMWRM